MTKVGSWELDEIHLVDAIAGLKQLPEESVDLIVTDPPYNVASKKKLTIKNNRPVSTAEMWGHWDTYHPFDYDLLILQMISECYRVLKPGGSLYVFTAREDNGYFTRLAKLRGFMYRNTLAMVKKNPLPSLHKANWRSGFELCMYLSKGQPKTFNFISQQECINARAYATAELTTDHPTEKPLSFIRRLVEVSSNPSELVLDPFMGSGTTALACSQTDRRFLGFETFPEYLQMARARLKEGVNRAAG